MGKHDQRAIRNLSPCKKEVRNPNRRWGLLFEREVLKGKKYCFPHSKGGRDQNFTVLCIAQTGGGKSSLGINTNLILEGSMALDRYAFDVQSTAESYEMAMRMSEDGKHGVYWQIDELKLYSRRSTSGFNVDMIDLLFSVRGFNIFTWANVVSLKAIDKLLVEEDSFDAIVYIYASQARFYWFTRKQFMKMVRNHGSYSHEVFQNYGKYYCSFDSYFSASPDELYAEYNERKKAGMRKISEEFIEKYATGDRLSLTKAAKAIGVSHPTLRKYVKQAVEEGLLDENPKTATGWGFTEDMLPVLRDYIASESPQGGLSL